MNLPTRHYVTLSSGKQLHYRMLGSGPPLIMLHPSPQSSEALTPAMQVYSQYCTCIAFDTPGYGLSDDIDATTPVMDDYVPPVLEAIGLLNIDKFAVYGVATGAQLAISLGKMESERVLLILLDTNGHLTEAEKISTLDGYMPSTQAIRSGGHLLTYWDMVRCLFVTFPWQSSTAAQRIIGEMPPVDLIHTVFLRYLNAGANYAKAYKAAFDTESADHLKGLTVPTSIMRWKGSIVLPWTDALLEFDLPENFTTLHADKSLEERFNVQLEYIKKQYVNDHYSPSIELENTAYTVNAYAGENVTLHLKKNLSGTGNPVILLHDLGQSSRQLLDLSASLDGNRPYYIIDLPGHGASLDMPSSTYDSFESYSKSVLSAVNTLPLNTVDIIGIGFGGMIAADLCDKMDNTNLVLVDPVSDALDEHIDLSPAYDAAHLVRAWSKVFNSEFYSPYNIMTADTCLSGDADIRPEELHLKAHDLLILGNKFNTIKALEQGFNWNKVLGKNDSVVIGHSSRQSTMSKSSLLQMQTKPVSLSEDRTLWMSQLGMIN